MAVTPEAKLEKLNAATARIARRLSMPVVSMGIAGEMLLCSAPFAFEAAEMDQIIENLAADFSAVAMKRAAAEGCGESFEIATRLATVARFLRGESMLGMH